MVELHPLRIIKYGTDKAALIGIGRLHDGKTAMGAVVKSIEMIENAPCFNARTGSAIREDGKCSRRKEQRGLLAPVTISI